jgi:hypothetical protein
MLLMQEHFYCKDEHGYLLVDVCRGVANTGSAMVECSEGPGVRPGDIAIERKLSSDDCL